MRQESQVIIVGAGLAGLTCALYLKKRNIPFVILESSDAPGGRILTDRLDGFLLDRGFQVFLTAYPEAQQILDYDQLKLQSLEPGALVRFQSDFHKVIDPFRQPAEFLTASFAAVGSPGDNINVDRLKNDLSGQALSEMLLAPESSTMNALVNRGLSSPIIERFFRPFFGGVFLDSELETTSRKFDFLFSMFSTGDVCIPLLGMEEIPKQLASKVGYENIRLNCQVAAVAQRHVVLSSGEQLDAKAVVVATQRSKVTEILYDLESAQSDQAVTCIYYACEEAPIKEPTLVLNGEGIGLINHLCVPSSISKAYAPAGKALVSVTVLGCGIESNQALDQLVRWQLRDWFGPAVEEWQRLRTYRIKDALPKQNPPTTYAGSIRYELVDGIFVCGDHMSTGSIDGALHSGRQVSELVADCTQYYYRCAILSSFRTVAS
jgi:phytoene dehydrogenase-like protein